VVVVVVVVVVVGVARTPGVVVGGAEVLGVLNGTVEPWMPGCAWGAGAVAPGCAEATSMPIQVVATPAPSTTAPVRNRIRACARSRARAACGRRLQLAD
jgi:hypothetical protein